MVEVLTEAHQRDMVRLGLSDIQECMPDIPVNEEKMNALTKAVRFDANREKYNIWLAYQEDECVGFAIGIIEEIFYSDAKAARLTSIYISPHRRSGHVLLKLLRAYEEWASNNGAVLSFCNIEREDIQQAAIACAVFPRLRYKWAGSTFTRRLNDGTVRT